MALDDDVLFAAAYLHDLAAFPPWANDKLDHSDVGADGVDTVLKGTGFPMAKIEAVRGAIRAHMYYRDASGPEALYLHDADALDWLGAIGAARILALVDPSGASPMDRKRLICSPTICRRSQLACSPLPAVHESRNASPS